ncbi:hypothetical protein IID20_03400, partial [Patescibacteria group bacterium]|nr:hypothetical protein [Patescibacteria group bacterium]
MEARVVIGDLFTEPNIYWASEFLAPDPVIYIETNSNKWLLVGGFEFGRAQKQVKKDVQVESIKQYRKDKGVPYFTALHQFLKKHKITKI